MSPKISVIVPVYNVERYLHNCLDSIINQDFNDMEIICVNDGSTDSSLDILVYYQKKDSRIKVYSQNNMGQSNARNYGLDVATGQYICFVDSDDMLVDGALDVLWETVEKDSSLQMVAYETAPLLYDSDFQNNNVYTDAFYKIKNEYLGIRKGREQLVELIENNDYIDSAWLLFIKRKFLEDSKIKFYNGAYYEDSIFSLECYLKVERMIHIKEQLYIYRIRSNSTMTSKTTFRNVYWRIWQYKELLKAIFLYAENDREINAISMLAKRVMGNIKSMYLELDDIDKEKVAKLTSIDNVIAESMGLSAVNVYNADLQLEGMLSVIRSCDRVILYGAGLVGGRLLSLLKKLQLDEKVVGFAVSATKPEEKNKDGKIIKYIGDYDADSVDLVVISACSHHSSMIREAKQNKFNNLLLVDYNIEHSINKMLV